MRKFLYLGIVFTLCATMLQQGNAQERKNRFGIVGGYTAGTQVMDPDPAVNPDHNINDTHDWVPGFQLGFRMERMVTENFYFTPMIMLVSSGDGFYHLNYERASDPDPLNKRFSEFYNYFITVPILYKYQFKTTGMPVEPYLIGGPELAFLVKCTQKPYVTVGILDPKDAPTDAKKVNAMKTSTWGLSFGGGFTYQMANSPLTLFVETRFSQGLQSYNENNPALNTVDINYRMILTTVGIVF